MEIEARSRQVGSRQRQLAALKKVIADDVDAKKTLIISPDGAGLILEELNRLEAAQFTAYKRGKIDGVKMYAHWRDGVQYVGTTGRTLKAAIEEIERE